MGLIKAALGATGGVLADQWKEYFYCEALPADVLVAKGVKRTSGRSSNTKGSDNIISNGSVIAVATGQTMIIVEQGKVVDICDEPGEFTYDMSTEPSIFCGSLSESVPQVLSNIGKRFTFGGEAPKDQRVYYINTKELMGNKYGTPNPVPFRIYDDDIGLKLTVSLKCFGEYSYRITNPVLFYTNVCGNIEYEYGREEIDSQLKSELLTSLQPALARVSQLKIMYEELPLHTKEIAKALNEELSEEWRDRRGIEIVSFGVSSVTATEEDENRIKEVQRNAIFRDPTMAAAHLAGAQAQAMQDAAKNEGGAMNAFMGMNMAQGAGSNIGNLFAAGQQQQATQQAHDEEVRRQVEAQLAQERAKMQAQQGGMAPGAGAAGGWTCQCGTTNTGKFCANCGSAKPVPAPGGAEWTCSCGTVNSGKFCSNCGTPKPADEWTCQCGAVNKGKFCANCGTPRP